MDLERLRVANLARCESSTGFNHSIDSWSLSDWFLAFIGELGEAANIGKKLNRCRDNIAGNTKSEEELLEDFALELGDAVIYLDLLAQSKGINLSEAVIKAFNGKSEDIGYTEIILY